MNDFELASPAFQNGQAIPQKYACDGEAISPPLSIQNVPKNAASLVLMSVDPDIPDVYKKQMGIDEFVHWILFDIPPTSTVIGEDSSVGIEGTNGMGQLGYVPPCPPKEYEPSKHRYLFTLYALNAMLGLEAGATKQQVLDAMQGHIIGQTQLMGTYQKA